MWPLHSLQHLILQFFQSATRCRWVLGFSFNWSGWFASLIKSLTIHPTPDLRSDIRCLVLSCLNTNRLWDDRKQIGINTNKLNSPNRAKRRDCLPAMHLSQHWHPETWLPCNCRCQSKITRFLQGKTSNALYALLSQLIMCNISCMLLSRWFTGFQCQIWRMSCITPAGMPVAAVMTTLLKDAIVLFCPPSSLPVSTSLMWGRMLGPRGFTRFN